MCSSSSDYLLPPTLCLLLSPAPCSLSSHLPPSLSSYQVSCEAIAVGACSLMSRKIKEELDHIAFAMALRSSGDPSADQWADAYYRTPRPFAQTPLADYPQLDRTVYEQQMPFRAVLVDETIPALWAHTTAANAEVTELDPPLRTALASARSLQDPYAETCHALAPDALKLSDLSLHPLMPTLPEASLHRALTAELVDGACRLGVSIGEVISFEHRSHVLPFVPGLGPRKGRALLRALQARASQSKPIIDRTNDDEGLKALLGECVWHNAVGFLHFAEEKRLVDPHRPPGLDGCRIHPERYGACRKMCFDAMVDEDDESEETEEKGNEAVAWAMSPEGMSMTEQGGYASVLDQLELEEFAQHLRDVQGAKIGKQTLEDCKDELCHPYRDTRGDCGARGPVEANRLFELLTSETDATLRQGSLVYAKFIRFEAGREFQGNYTPGRMHISLQSGLAGFINEDNISDKWAKVPTESVEDPMSGRPIEKPNLPIAEGTTISMKVLDIDKNQFTVVGSCKGADLRSAMIGTLAEQEKQKAAEKAKQAQSRMYTKRRIGHPLFKNGSLDQVTQVLMPAPVGEVIFRPSSKGPGHLTATVKLTAEVCAQISRSTPQSSPPSPHSLTTLLFSHHPPLPFSTFLSLSPRAPTYRALSYTST